MALGRGFPQRIPVVRVQRHAHPLEGEVAALEPHGGAAPHFVGGHTGVVVGDDGEGEDTGGIGALGELRGPVVVDLVAPRALLGVVDEVVDHQAAVDDFRVEPVLVEVGEPQLGSRWPRLRASAVVPLEPHRLHLDEQGLTHGAPDPGGHLTLRVLVEPHLNQRELLLRAASVLKNGVTLRISDFEKSMSKAGKGDVVYCDPTYSVAHDNNGFLRYNERIFSWSDQQRLARAAKAAAKRGATVLVSNAHHNSLRNLYADAHAMTLQRPSCVSATLQGRRRVAEYLFILDGKATRKRQG